MVYLRSLQPVPGRPPQHEVSFPLTIRRPIGLWKLLYLDRTPIEIEAAHDESWNRGHYLVAALAHLRGVPFQPQTGGRDQGKHPLCRRA